MMMEGRNAVMRWSASSPSPAASVVKPQVRTSSVSPSARARLVLDDQDALAWRWWIIDFLGSRHAGGGRADAHVDPSLSFLHGPAQQ